MSNQQPNPKEPKETTWIADLQRLLADIVPSDNEHILGGNEDPGDESKREQKWIVISFSAICIFVLVVCVILIIVTSFRRQRAPEVLTEDEENLIASRNSSASRSSSKRKRRNSSALDKSPKSSKSSNKRSQNQQNQMILSTVSEKSEILEATSVMLSSDQHNSYLSQNKLLRSSAYRTSSHTGGPSSFQNEALNSARQSNKCDRDSFMMEEYQHNQRRNTDAESSHRLLKVYNSQSRQPETEVTVDQNLKSSTHRPPYILPSEVAQRTPEIGRTESSTILEEGSIVEQEAHFSGSNNNSPNHGNKINHTFHDSTISSQMTADNDPIPRLQSSVLQPSD